jgi:hypothetical protein
MTSASLSAMRPGNAWDLRFSRRSDLYWMNIETGKKVRLTFAPGADVLPVFSPD